jgi:hypothetical protein
MAINTTGELRTFVASMMLGVKNGDVAIDKAREITKMAAAITESFYAEVRVATTTKEAGGVAANLGALPLGESGEDK